MSKYIDADDLFDLINDCVSATYEDAREVKDEVLSIIAEKKGADVEPVRHGHWVERFEGTYVQRRMYCSICAQKSGIGGILKNQKKPYCPNCGAKMDGKEPEQ